MTLSKTPAGAATATNDSGQSGPTLSEQLGAYHLDSPFSPYDPKTGEGLDRADPTASELLVPYVAPGKPADVPIGVMYRADHETLDDGMCRQARTHARALARAGVPLALRTIANRVRHGNEHLIAADDVLSEAVWNEVGHLRQVVMKRTAILIVHAVIQSPRHLFRLLVPDYLLGDEKAIAHGLGSSIVYTPWERDRVNPEIIKILNKVGQVWLQCKRNVDAFVASGLDPQKVRLVPNAYDPDAMRYRVSLRPPAPGKRFYNIAKWEPRKDQVALLGAFLHAYKPGDAASLFLKTFDYRRWPGYLRAREAIGYWLEQPEVKAQGWTAENVKRHVFIDERVFSDDQLTRLHRLSNVYVSASHAEGWDYPAFDAVACGNRLVHVGFGGSEDYARPDDVRIPFTMSGAHPSYQWEKEAEWAVYDFADLVNALKTVEPLVVRMSPGSLRRYSISNMGARMRLNVSELAEKVAPELIEAMG
jgi:glycosyltransferase involved in cell wall biosynthesis